MLNGPMESDEALSVRIVFLKEIIDKVGIDKFNEAVKEAIRISEFRSQVTIGRIRRLCGLSMAEPPSPAAEAWVLVTEVVQKFVQRDVHGNAVLEPRVIVSKQHMALMEEVPNIPDAVQKAVDFMGGWGALQDAHPTWWNQRWSVFKDVYRP